MKSLSRLRLVSLGLVVFLALGQLAWTDEADAFGQTLRDFFSKTFAAGSNCARMAVKMKDWREINETDAEAKAAALIAAVERIDSEPDLDGVDDTIGSAIQDVLEDDEKLEAFGVCLEENSDVATHVAHVESTLISPVSAAIRERREAIAAAAVVRGTPADMEVAELAANSFSRLVRLYRETVEFYQADGCAVLARAHDHWFGNYFENLGSTFDALSTQVERMTPDEWAAFAPRVDTLAADGAALETAAACLDELEGEDRDYLDRQVSSLRSMLALIEMSVPEAP